jgi:ribosomal-protein-alanine N-acetyltransferase
MRLVLPRCVVRAWSPTDRASLVKHADNPAIAANLRDRFPSPYTLDDADRYLTSASARTPLTSFAIEVDGDAAGGISLMLHDDVVRLSAELGYWLGETYWGQGVMTEAVRAVTDWGFAALSLTRVYALPFHTSAASVRVLEKAGFVCEGRLRRSAIKHGQILDQFVYADVR